jgi:hypothetical protein
MIGTTASDAAEAESPASFVAVTTNVYFVPLVSSRTVHVNSVPVAEHVLPSGEEVTVYFETGSPPLSLGAVQLTATSPFAATTVGVPGADATVPALKLFAFEDAPLPAVFVAATVITYELPTLRPVNLQDVAGMAAEHVTVAAPVAVAVAVYEAIAAPPSDSGASHDTFISVREVRETATFFGALGTQFVAHEYNRRFGDDVALPTLVCNVSALRVPFARILDVISLGVAEGVCCSNIAAAPVTNGVAIDVPVLL